MKLVIAGIEKNHQEGISVAELLQAENVRTPMYVTVSVNDEFVKTEEQSTTLLRDNDVIEFLYFMGGGEG
jgi:sulfur carrier protein